MNSEIERLRQAADKANSTAEALKAELARKIAACQHQWGATVADHIYTPGFTDPGDKPGTMGVDFRGPCYIPPTTKKQWKRTCTICGKVEYTSATTQHVSETPRF